MLNGKSLLICLSKLGIQLPVWELMRYTLPLFLIYVMLILKQLAMEFFLNAQELLPEAKWNEKPQQTFSLSSKIARCGQIL